MAKLGVKAVLVLLELIDNSGDLSKREGQLCKISAIFNLGLFSLLCDLLLCDESHRLLMTPARWQGVYFPLNARNLAL